MAMRKGSSAKHAAARGRKQQDLQSLVDAAWKVRDQAVAPYSGFQVGAALRSADGRLFTGCNVENSTYGLTVCAERVAVLKAISEGAREFTAIAIVTGGAKVTPPCGSCRQILWEFCGDIEVLLANANGSRRKVHLRRLFPEPFEDSFFRPRR